MAIFESLGMRKAKPLREQQQTISDEEKARDMAEEENAIRDLADEYGLFLANPARYDATKLGSGVLQSFGNLKNAGFTRDALIKVAKRYGELKGASRDYADRVSLMDAATLTSEIASLRRIISFNDVVAYLKVDWRNKIEPASEMGRRRIVNHELVEEQLRLAEAELERRPK